MRLPARRLRPRLAGAPALRSNWAIGLALALLGLAVWLPPVTLQRPTYSYLVSFDITQSMNVEDMPSADGASISRLAAARTAMRRVLERMPCGSRVGWAVFADYRSLPLLLPLEVCSHYEQLLAALDKIDGRMRWADASNVGKGVSWAVRSARAIDTNTRIVFLTDGQEAPPLRPGETPPIHDLTPGAVGGWIVGVGGERPARIPRSDREGNAIGWWQAEDVVQRDGVPPAQSHEHLSELREDHLRGLATLMGLDYQRLTTGDALADGLLDARFARAQPVQTDVRWVAAMAALVLLAARFHPLVWRDGRRRH